jgi:ribonucleoside-diphosphate reductase alpha chain
MNFPPISQSNKHLDRRSALRAKNRFQSHGRKIDVPRGGKRAGSVVREKIAKHGMRNSNFFAIAHETIIDDAARRQKWIDPSQSVNLFLATPEMQGASARSNLNRTHRRAWDKGLKTTYYLRTLQARNIEKSAIDVKKEQRGLMATQTAATAAETKQFTEAEKNECSLDAMLNGGTCEACQ